MKEGNKLRNATIGRIIVGLYGQVVPKTVENFRVLFTGEKGKSSNGLKLHYKGTRFHRIISSFGIQGEDIVHQDGRGYESIYGGTFPDENFKTKHSHAVFITTVKASWLDGEHVVFGRVVEGMDTVFAIEGGAGTYSGKPRKNVVISDSGEIPQSQWDEQGRISVSK
ncbi:hypothetical protein K1719_015194 [Acacia pycnantha]|nr:hypothetical protein K1719_015194 [Acacia pycnantha]